MRIKQFLKKITLKIKDREEPIDLDKKAERLITQNSVNKFDLMKGGKTCEENKFIISDVKGGLYSN